MKRLIASLISATLGLFVAWLLVPRVQLAAGWELFILLGIILGLLHYFVKPALNLVTLPLRIITLGLFGFVINAGLIFALDYFFKEFSAPLWWPLFWTTIIVSFANSLISTIITKKS